MCVRCGIAATAAVYAMRTRASDRAAGLPRGRTGMARQHSLVVCISARPRRKRWASDTGEVRIMMRGLGQATDEARKATKQAYCSFSRGAPGEGDKGAMLGCHAVSVGRNFTSEYYASPSDSSPRLRHNRGCEVHRTRARCKGWTAHQPTAQRSLPTPPMSAHSIRSAVHGASQQRPRRHTARTPSWSITVSR